MSFGEEFSCLSIGGFSDGEEDDGPLVVGAPFGSLAKLAALASDRLFAVEPSPMTDDTATFKHGVVQFARDFHFANKGAIERCFGLALPSTSYAYSMVMVASHLADTPKETAKDAATPTQKQLDDPGFLGDVMITSLVDQVVFTEHSDWQSLMRFFADEHRSIFVRDTIARGISAPRPLRTARTPPPPPKDVIGSKRVVVCPLPGAFDPVLTEGTELNEDSEEFAEVVKKLAMEIVAAVRLDLSASPRRSSLRSSPSPPSPSPRKLSFADAAILHPHTTRDACPRPLAPMQSVADAAAETRSLMLAFGTKSVPHPLADGEFAFAFGLGKRWIDFCY
jgi:hypothetical protein